MLPPSLQKQKPIIWHRRMSCIENQSQSSLMLMLQHKDYPTSTQSLCLTASQLLHSATLKGISPEVMKSLNTDSDSNRNDQHSTIIHWEERLLQNWSNTQNNTAATENKNLEGTANEAIQTANQQAGADRTQRPTTQRREPSIKLATIVTAT